MNGCQGCRKVVSSNILITRGSRGIPVSLTQNINHVHRVGRIEDTGPLALSFSLHLESRYY